MPTMPAISDYTNRDYESLVSSLLELAAQRLPEWTDRSENDVGRMLVDLFAYVGDVLSYYQDRIVGESFLATAVERRSVIDLLALIGYTLATPAPATATLHVTVPDDATTPVTVDVGAIFSTVAAPGKPAVEFTYLPVTGVPRVVDRSGGGGTVEFDITVTNARRIEHESLGTATGEANESFRLAQRPVLLPRDPDSPDWLAVELNATGQPGAWERWSRRETFLNSLSLDAHYVVRIDDQDQAEIVVGDGSYGRVPPLGAAFRASYLTGGGEAGNVGPNSITAVKSGVSARATVTNPLGAAGGADRETIEHARRHAPRVYRSMRRAVTAQDYAALAENYPGVARATAVAASWNYVDLYVVASGALTLTDALRAQLLQYFEGQRPVTTLVQVREPVFVSIDSVIDIGVEPTSYAVDVARRARLAIESLFALERMDFGQQFHISKLYESVEAIDGVEFAECAFSGRRSVPPGQKVATPVPGRLPLTPREFPRLGTIEIRTTGGLQ